MRKMKKDSEEEDTTEVVMVERSTTESQESTLMMISRMIPDQSLLLAPQSRPVLPRNSTEAKMKRKSKVHVDPMESTERSTDAPRDAESSSLLWLS